RPAASPRHIQGRIHFEALSFRPPRLFCYRPGYRLPLPGYRTIIMDPAILPRRSNALGVHSVNRFAFSVPDLPVAEQFYRAFGLDVRRAGERLDLYTEGHPHCWGSIYANGKPKKLQYLSFGAYEDDFVALGR